MKKCLKITILGRVQGVWYRASTERKANELGICGFVQNEPNGNVYIECEGSDEQLKSLISWCKKGPPLANVSNIKIENGELVGFDSFSIKR